MTSALQNQLMGYFEIAFITDPLIDLMCAEALSDQVPYGRQVQKK